MLSAVIYDMDGVIIDSEPLWRRAIVEKFADFGIKLTLDMCRRTMGLRMDEVTHYWFGLYKIDMSLAEKAENAVVDRVAELMRTEGQAMAGVEESLRFWKSKNMKLALASSSAMRLIDTALDALHLRSYFDVVHSAEFEPLGKPHPGVYLTAAQKMGVPAPRCLAIEDSINGMIAAKAARMKCIGIPEAAVHDDKRLAIADMVLPSLTAVNDGVWGKFQA